MFLNKFKKAGRSLFAAGLSLISFASLAQVPANDACTGAQVINIPSSGTACVTGTTTGATSDLTTNTCDTGTPGNEVWYTFIATGSQNTVTVTPTGSPAAQQVVVTMLSTGCASNTYSTCSSSATNAGSATVNWTYTPGTQVWLSIETNGADGNFQVCVTSVTPPATTGSSCATATTLCNMNSFSVGTFPANNNGFSPSCFFPPGTALQQPIFYQFTVGQTGSMQWSADPTGTAEYDWAVYNITSGCPGTQVACNYNYGNSVGTAVGMSPGPGSCSGETCDPVTVTAGQTYIIIIDNYSNNSVGFNFDWTGSTFTIAPTAQFTVTPTTGCAPVTACFTNTSIAATSYQWNLGNSVSSTATTPACQTYSTPGTYLVSLTATSATGCTNTASASVIVNPIPTSNAGPDKVICSGASTTIGSASTTGYTYSWSPTTGLSSGTAANPTVTLTNNTTAPVNYTYTVTTSANSCTSTDVVVVTVNPVPPSNAGADITLCSGVAGSIGTAPTAGYSYSWSPSTGLSSSTSANPTVTLTNITTAPVSYTYTVTTSVGTCSTTDAVIVTINPIPPSNAGPDKVICSGASTTIGTASVATYTYSWSPTTGLSSGTVANPTVTLTNNTTAPVNYTYTVTTSVGTCSTTDAVVVTVNPVPPSNAGADISFCSGGSGSIGTASIAGYTYSWSPTTGLSSGTVSNPTVTLTNVTTAPVTYTYTVTTSVGTCSTTDAVVVTVNPIPVSNAGADITICSGATGNIGTASTAGYTYSWSPTTGLSNGTASNPTVTLTNNTAAPVTYTYTVTTSANSCTSTDAVVVTVNPIPVANAGPDVSLCNSGSTTLNATGGGTYAWTPAAGLSATNISNPVATPTVTTTYTVTVTVGGCSSTDAVLISVGSLAANAGPDVAICQGSNTQLTATGGTTYSWTPATGLSTTNIANPVASPTVTTTYTVSVSNSTCSGTDMITVTVNPIPVSNAGADIAFCSGATGNLGTASTAGYTYSWSPATGLSSTTASNPTVTLTNNTSSPVTTTYNVTTTSNSCTSTDAVAVTVNPIPVANAGADIAICSGATGNLGAAATTGYTYSWSPTTGLSSATASNPTVTLTNNTASPVTATYVVTTTSNSCTSTDTVIVTINPIPVSNAGADIAFCSGATGNLGAASTAGYTYSWSPATGLSSTTASNPTVTLTNNTASPVSTTYNVTTTANGCTSTDAVVVTVNPIPVANAGADATICPSASTQIGSSPSAGYTYSWSPTTGLSSATASNPTATPPSTTTYIVTATSNGCTATDAVTVTIANNLVASTTPDDTICFGASTPISVTPSGASYSWSPAAGLSNSTIQSPVASPTVTTVYTVTVTDAGGCTGTDMITITVDPALTLSAAGFSSTCFGSCNGQAVVIPGGGTQPYSYSWSSGCVTPSCNNLCAGTYTITVTDVIGCSISDTAIVTEPALLTLQTSSLTAHCSQADGSATGVAAGGTSPYSYLWSPGGQTTATAINLTPGQYCLTVTDLNGCTATSCVTVANAPGVTANISSSTNATCNGSCNGSATVTAASGTAPYNYSWSSGGTGTIENGLCAGTYTVTVTDVNGCSTTATVTITQPTVVTVTPSQNTTICISQCTTLSANGAGGTPAYTYSWSSPSTTVCPVVTTTYTVTATDANGCLSAPATVTITVNPPLNITAAGGTTICPGSSATLTGNPAGGNGSYTMTWLPVNQAGGSITVTPASTTTYTVVLTDACGTPPDSATVTVTVSPLPVVSFSADSLTGCFPVCTSFTDNSTISSGTITSWQWSFGDGNTSATQSPSNCYAAAGTYSVTLTVTSANGCSQTATINNMITAYDYPVAEFSFGPQPATITDPTICFTDQSTGASSWYWNFADISDSTSTLQNPCHSYSDTANYCIDLIVINTHGCRDTITHCLTISPDFSFWIPNAFTPNDDGTNDEFSGVGMFIQKYEMYIFDRWGNMIFYTDDFNKKWNGKANYGKEVAQEDVYVYRVNLTDIFEKKHTYMGHVTLIK